MINNLDLEILNIFIPIAPFVYLIDRFM